MWPKTFWVRSETLRRQPRKFDDLKKTRRGEGRKDVE